MAGAQASQLDRRVVIGAAVVAVVLVVVVAVLVGRGGDSDQVITRTFDRAPAELPAGLVPAGATEVQGQVTSQRGEWLSAAVEYSVASGDRDEIAQAAEQAADEAGWALFERVYDATTMIVRWNDAEGSALTMTLRTEGAAVQVGAVAVRAATG